MVIIVLRPPSEVMTQVVRRFHGHFGFPGQVQDIIHLQFDQIDPEDSLASNESCFNEIFLLAEDLSSFYGRCNNTWRLFIAVQLNFLTSK